MNINGNESNHMPGEMGNNNIIKKNVSGNGMEINIENEKRKEKHIQTHSN